MCSLTRMFPKPFLPLPPAPSRSLPLLPLPLPPTRSSSLFRLCPPSHSSLPCDKGSWYSLCLCPVTVSVSL